ncbi:MAG: hypothetical protein LRY22_01600 [Aliarcobacter cryaerophilus]|nr:hypothetical protein [Aliarcobacter cryaerophilus]
MKKENSKKKVIKTLQDFNKKEYAYKKSFQELSDRIKQLESYIPRLQEELEEQKAKTLSRQRQLDHYELQMHNVDEKYYGHMTTKSKEAEEYSKNVLHLKQEKNALAEKIKSQQEEILATKKELALLTETNEQKNKRILEVGCGIGLSSLILNRLNADITATDYHPEAEKFLDINTELNKDDENSICKNLLE